MLSERERFDLAAEILATLETSDPPGEVEAAWAAEIDARAERALADPDGGVPWEGLRDELRDRLRRR